MRWILQEGNLVFVQTRASIFHGRNSIPTRGGKYHAGCMVYCLTLHSPQDNFRFKMGFGSMLDFFNMIFCCGFLQPSGNNSRGRSTTVRKRNVNASRRKGKKTKKGSRKQRVAPDTIPWAVSGSERMVEGDETEDDLDPIKLIPISNFRNSRTNNRSQEWKRGHGRNVKRLRKSKGKSRAASDCSVSTRASQFSADDTLDETRSMGSQSFSQRLHRTRNRAVVKING